MMIISLDSNLTELNSVGKCLKYVSIKMSKFKILLSTWPAFSQEGPNCVSSN